MIAGILLAAGTSSRFGSNKLLHTMNDGRTILSVSAGKLQYSVDHTLAVIRPDDDTGAALLDELGIEKLVCDQANKGMGASLSCGVQAMPDAKGWIIALADMPFIAPETYAGVVASIKSGSLLAAPFYNFKRGHPVGFSATLFNELVVLQDDTGAKNLIAKHADELHALECDDPGVIRDVDTPADLAT